MCFNDSVGFHRMVVVPREFRVLWRICPSPEEDERNAQRFFREKFAAEGLPSDPTATAAAKSIAPIVPSTGIRVRARRGSNPFRSRRFQIQVDGSRPISQPWEATSVIPVCPGSHVVKCYFLVDFFLHGGGSAVAVDVPPGQIVAVVYIPPKWGMWAGTCLVQGRSEDPLAEDAQDIP